MRSAEAFAPDLFAKAEKARGKETHAVVRTPEACVKGARGCPHPGYMR